MVKDSTTVVLTLTPGVMHGLFPLLQHGVMVDALVGSSIRTVLNESLQLSPEYIEDRIKTILLNGNPVDDIDTVIITEGSTLALSAAMPGLVGASLRRGGPLASLRSQITQLAAGESSSLHRGMITVKLFNVLIGEIGLELLRRGVSVRREDFENFVMRLSDEFWQGCTAATVGGQDVRIEQLRNPERLETSHLVMLRIEQRG